MECKKEKINKISDWLNFEDYKGSMRKAKNAATYKDNIKKLN